jgi:hypothetical protein
MQKMLTRAALAGVLGAAIMAAPALAAPAGASPGDGNYCYSQPGQSGCTAQWTADVNGEYGGVTSGSWAIQQQSCTTDPTTGVTTCVWNTIASGGAGGFYAQPGALTPGNIYQLVITGNGGGALGSITGTGAI